MKSKRQGILAGLLVALTSIAWLDPHQAVRAANRLYGEGKYDDAAAGYNAALVDHPDSADLHFNLGDATYKQGKYEEAVSSFQKVETATDPRRASRVAYNVGNATYRQGQALEQAEPQKALGLYAEALASYRRALGLAPDDEDAKFNHELVTKHVEDLKKKLEEQKKEQEQQKQDQKQDDQKQDEQQQDQQKKDEQQKDQQQQDQQKQDDQQQPQDQQEKKDEQQQQQGGDDQQQPPQDEQKDQQQGQPDEQKEPPPSEDKQEKAQQGGEPNEDSASPEQQGQPSDEAVAGEHKDGELSKGEAAAILDSQRGEEVSPEDIIKKLQGARVAEPGQDW